MARSLVDAAQWARTDDEARALVAAGCQQRLVIAAEILDVVERMPRARRRALVLDTARMVADGATSLPEIDFAMLCRRAGLPLPDRQVERRDARGRRRYLDVYWAAFRLHVEIDGAWHTEVRAWWADMRRQNDLWIAGDRVLRFPAWLVRTRPAEVAAQVRAALVAAGWRP
jgi:very-short-patch-repair endonuclease